MVSQTTAQTRTQDNPMYHLAAAQVYDAIDHQRFYRLAVEDSDRSMYALLPVIPHLTLLLDLDLSQLSSYEPRVVQTVAHDFYNAAHTHLERLERLRLGPACLDLSNGADEHGLWDVCYLSKHLPQFQRLRTLEFDFESGKCFNSPPFVIEALVQKYCFSHMVSRHL
jgi:hypothetical protein